MGDYIAYGISKSTADTLVSKTNLCDTGEAKSKSSTEKQPQKPYSQIRAQLEKKYYIAFTRPLRGLDTAMHFEGKN